MQAPPTLHGLGLDICMYIYIYMLYMQELPNLHGLGLGICVYIYKYIDIYIYIYNKESQTHFEIHEH